MQKPQQKRWRSPLWWIVVGVWLLVLAALFSKAEAAPSSIANPDALLLDNIFAYDGVLQQGDLLLIIEYEINYTTLPTETANSAYLFRFLNGGSEKKVVAPFSFNNKGYRLGLVSMYFTKADKDTASIEFSNPNAESYQVILQGNPTFFPVPPSVTSTAIT